MRSGLRHQTRFQQANPDAGDEPNGDNDDGKQPPAKEGEKAGEGVGKSAGAPFRKSPSPPGPIAYPRHATMKAAVRVKATWAAVFATQSKAAAAAIRATFSKLAKADEPGDEPSSEERRRVNEEIEEVITGLDLSLERRSDGRPRRCHARSCR